MLTFTDIHDNNLVRAFITEGNNHLGVMGYTDHGFGHVSIVSDRAALILRELGDDGRQVELAAIAGYMHDIGNVINREGHSQSGALMAVPILTKLGMPPEEISLVAAAIGNHDEGTGMPVNRIAAALIMADKSHVHRTRVRNQDMATFDIHDRVNYGVNHAFIEVLGEERRIVMDVTIDLAICSVMEYFEIFLTRMIMCRRAASFLDCRFELLINGARLI